MKVTPYGHICHKLLHSPVYITNTLIIRCNFFRFIGRKPITCPSNNCLQIMVCHAQSSRLRKQPTFGDATTVSPAKWRLRNERRNSLLMTRHSPDLGSASDWLCGVGNLIQAIRGTTQIWGLTRHQYGIFVLVSQTSFGGKTSGSVAKCRLFSQAKCRPTVLFLQIISGSCVNETTLFSFLQSLLREKWQIASLPKDVH